MKNCEYLGKAISSPLMLGGRYTPRQWSCQKIFVSPKMVAILNFKVFAKHKNAYISKTMLDGANSTKFLTCWVSLQSSHANFQNIFVSPNIADILNFRIVAKHKIAYILKTVLDRADCADFGCHNSIRLETKHFLNTLALTLYPFRDALFLLCKNIIFFFCERSSSYILSFEFCNDIFLYDINC